MTLNTYTVQPMSLPGINFLHLTLSEIQPRQTFSWCLPTQPPAHPDTMGESNIPNSPLGLWGKNDNTTYYNPHCLPSANGKPNMSHCHCNLQNSSTFLCYCYLPHPCSVTFQGWNKNIIVQVISTFSMPDQRRI